MELEARFWDKVDYDSNDYDRCWPWQASLTKGGYGKFGVGGRGIGWLGAHRIAYALTFGDPPEVNEDDEPLELDHICHDPGICFGGPTCRHRRCCNPEHLRLGTRSDNMDWSRRVNNKLRNTHCPQGHPYSEENTIVETNPPARRCRICRTEQALRRVR